MRLKQLQCFSMLVYQRCLTSKLFSITPDFRIRAIQGYTRVPMTDDSNDESDDAPDNNSKDGNSSSSSSNTTAVSVDEETNSSSSGVGNVLAVPKPAVGHIRGGHHQRDNFRRSNSEPNGIPNSASAAENHAAAAAAFHKQQGIMRR